MKTTGNFLDFAGCAGGIEGLGPGKRAVMWVRGCPLACPGCMTPELWSPGSSTSLVSIEEVASLIRPLLIDSDGLTISGGESMRQPAALLNLVRLLRRENEGIEVLVYSGYTIEEIMELGADAVEFLSEIDILIDGRFLETESNDLPWRGSDNQRILYLSPKSQRHEETSVEDMENRPLQIQNMGLGQFRIVGIPKRGDMERYRKLMGERGLGVEKIKKA